MSSDTVYGGNYKEPVGLSMEKFPRAEVQEKQRALGHPIRLTGMHGSRLRIKSQTGGEKK